MGTLRDPKLSALARVFQLAVVTLAPLVPLTLTMISLEELLKRLLSAVF